MSDVTKKERITISYYCTETEQEAIVQIDYTKGEHSYSAEINTTFVPPIEDETKDPMGILGRLLESLNGG